ncbi:MAG TPA: hypothetical protein PLY93_08290 [Turneriella sp.]|nr:hypothetical protein [Turneriella sp.]
MSELRVPDIALPRNYVRVVHEEKITKEDVEKVRRALQERIDTLENELKREKEIAKKLSKSSAVLQDILTAPAFKALSLETRKSATETVKEKNASIAHVDEAPVEYVDVTEIEISDTMVSQEESQSKK